MARRDSSAASRSSSSARSRGARSAGPRGRSDGKVDIYCPQCGAHFRLAETALDTKVECSECTRTFLAKSTAGKRAKAPDYTKVYVGFGVGALLIVGTLVLMSQSGGKPAPQPVAIVPATTQLDIDRQTRREQTLRWARAIAGNDLLTLRNYSDLPAIRQQLGVDAALTGDALDAALLAALKTNEATRLFYEMECASSDLSAESVQAGTGPATLYFNTRPGVDYYDAKAGAQITIQWRMEGSQMKVGGFQLTAKPVLRGRRPGDASRTFKPSAEIAKPKVVEVEINGRKKAVNESQPVAIAHLADTPPELQQTIDRLVADLIRSADPESPGALFARTTTKLKEIGKPAMPRLINALHDLYGDVNANNQKISQVTRALLDLTGMAFAYDVVGTGDAAKDKVARESSIRQWFAWWWRFANDTYQDAIDQSEDLLAPKATDTKPAK